MPENQTVGEYRLSELEKVVKELVIEVRGLPDKFDAKFATKAEVKDFATKAELKDVRDDVTVIQDEGKTRRTGIRSIYVTIAGGAALAVISGLVGFIVWVAQQVVHVSQLGG